MTPERKKGKEKRIVDHFPYLLVRTLGENGQKRIQVFAQVPRTDSTSLEVIRLWGIRKSYKKRITALQEVEEVDARGRRISSRGIRDTRKTRKDELNLLQTKLEVLLGEKTQPVELETDETGEITGIRLSEFENEEETAWWNFVLENIDLAPLVNEITETSPQDLEWPKRCLALRRGCIRGEFGLYKVQEFNTSYLKEFPDENNEPLKPLMQRIRDRYKIKKIDGFSL